VSVEITFQRSPHDREHPYTMISNQLLDNMEISHNLKMLLIYCLRKPNTWVFSLQNLIDMMGFCKRWVYKILDEGIAHGYITRTQQKFKGKFQNTVYYFSEEPKFKKCSPCAQNRHAEKCTPSLYINTNEFEAPSQEHSHEENSKPLERDDIEALPFSQKDKRQLKQYPRDAIAYAKRCISKMPETPDKPIAVFTSLCKTHMSRLERSAQGKAKSYEKSGPVKNNSTKQQEIIKEVKDLCRIAGVYCSESRDDLLVGFDGIEYSAFKCQEALFEKVFNNCIRMLYEKISRAT